ncbi:MAG: hypothetical protein PHR35_12095 [Kiritimatiellae bacterium]|nr:hypothetical protein [Kiritimatiellia bacterium]
MRAAAERIRTALASLWPAAGFSVFFVLAFYVQNHANLILPALWAPLLLALGMALALWAPLFIWLRDPRATAVAAALLAFYNGLHGCLMLYVPARTLWRPESWAEPMRLSLALGGFVLAVAAGLTTRKHPRGTAVAAGIAACMAVALLTVSVVGVAAIEVRRALLIRADTPPDGPVAIADEQAPTIVHLVLDGYARDDVLRDLYGHDNSAFLDWLEAKGFRVLRRARSNYSQTALSIASTLNMRYLDAHLKPHRESADRAVLARLIGRSDVAARLRRRGYEIVAYPTGYCATDALEADIRWPSGTLAEFTMACLGRSWIGSLTAGGRAYADHARRADTVLSTLPAAVASPRPRYIYARLGAPHPPFVYDARGLLPPPERFTLDDGSHLVNDAHLSAAAYREAYLSQLCYLTSRVKTTIEELLRRCPRPLVIVLQSDHGPASQWNWHDLTACNARERTAILCALYFPDRRYEALRADLTAVNLFRVVLGQYAGYRLPLLPDRVLLSTWRQPYLFREAPDNVKACGSREASTNSLTVLEVAGNATQ